MFIDHIGIAVKSLDQAIASWTKMFGYRQMTEIVVNTRQKVKVVFLDKPDSITVKLIEPLDEGSPISAFVGRGGGLHHLCFKCDELQPEIERLRAAGCRSLVAPQPGEAFENELIAFLMAPNFLNIELIDTPKKALIRPETASS
ncbi:MAG: VOC family protein [Acidobacteriota bacterium]